MATSGEYRDRIKPRVARFCVAIAFGSLISLASFGARAEDKQCGSVKECAQQMIDLANDLKAQNIALTKRIEDLEAALAKQAKDTAAAIEARITQLKGGSEVIPQPLGNSRTTPCPSGAVMVAILFQSDSGGPHGITSALAPVCRTLN